MNLVDVVGKGDAVLTKSGVAGEEPATSDTGIMMQLLAVLFKPDSILETLVAHSTRKHHISNTPWILETTRLQRINPLEELVSLFLPKFPGYNATDRPIGSPRCPLRVFLEVARFREMCTTRC